MRFSKRHGLWIIGIILAGLVLSAWVAHPTRTSIVIRGAVIEANTDPSRQSPLTEVAVSVSSGLAPETRSDFLGYFSLTLQPWVKQGEPISLHFRHPNYVPLDINGKVGDQIFIARMAPVKPAVETADNSPDHPEVTIGNVVVRYSIETSNATNIGNGVKMFQVTNAGNVACNRSPVCSPDGKWKAQRAEVTLDAGPGNEFRNARLTCIAGPCPFTRIDSDRFSAGGRIIGVSVRNWSDATTFVLQAEVFRVQVYDLVRQYYPTIIGRTLNFSLPAGASGLTIEAEVNGLDIQFALGPQPILSWADCKVSQNRDSISAYRCELKPWCRFR